MPLAQDTSVVRLPTSRSVVGPELISNRTLTEVITTTAYGWVLITDAATTLGSYVRGDVAVRAGLYRVVTAYQRTSAAGIFELRVNGVAYGAQVDAWVSSGTLNAIHSVDNVLFGEGDNVVELVIVGKNASTATYVMRISGFSVKKTGDV